MKEVVAYQSEDGWLHKTAEDARKQDEMIVALRRGPIPLNILSRRPGKPIRYRIIYGLSMGSASSNQTPWHQSDYLYEVEYKRGETYHTHLITHSKKDGEVQQNEWKVYNKAKSLPRGFREQSARPPLDWCQIRL